MAELNTVEDTAVTEVDSWKPKAVIIGTALGALVGLGTALLLINRIDEGEKLEVSAAEGVKLGLAGLTFLRTVTQLAD